MKKISFKVRSGENINKKRLVTAMVFFAVLLTGLLCRLFYIQIMCHDDLAEAAVSQYEITLEGMDTRGRIFDRNMKPITGGTYQYYYIIKREISPLKERGFWRSSARGRSLPQTPNTLFTGLKTTWRK